MNENLTLTDFISDFDNLYGNHKEIIFNLFQNGSFSFEEQKEIFDSLQTKQKCQLFNTISLTARDNYCEFLKELEPTVNDKGKTIVPFDDFISKIRGQAVKDKISNEMRLLDEGKCTRDWSLDQIKDMFQFSKKTDKLSTVPGTPKAYDEYGNPLYYIVNNNGKYTVKQYSIDGHHIKNVNDNPLLAGDSNNIQMLSRAPENGNMSEHQLAHGGNFSNETIAYYDGENYIGVDFTSPVVNEEGKYTPGEYKGNGKAYYFDDELGFVEITDETNSSYIKVQKYNGEKIPPEMKSKFFPSVNETKEIFGEDIYHNKLKTDLDKFNSRIGMAEYKQLGIEINDLSVSNKAALANHLKDVGSDASVLEKTSIVFNDDGSIEKVVFPVTDHP